MSHDFATPEGRAVAAEQLGHGYNAAFAAWRESQVLETVAGHKLRPVATRFGRLIQVGDTGTAFRWIGEARDYAEAHPLETIDQLTTEYQDWCARNGLPQISADELLHETLTDEQRRYVSEFLIRWDEAAEREGY